MESAFRSGLVAEETNGERQPHQGTADRKRSYAGLYSGDKNQGGNTATSRKTDKGLHDLCNKFERSCKIYGTGSGHRPQHRIAREARCGGGRVISSRFATMAIRAKSEGHELPWPGLP